MEMDCNLKNCANFFKLYRCVLEKSLKLVIVWCLIGNVMEYFKPGE